MWRILLLRPNLRNTERRRAQQLGAKLVHYKVVQFGVYFSFIDSLIYLGTDDVTSEYGRIRFSRVKLRGGG